MLGISVAVRMTEPAMPDRETNSAVRMNTARTNLLKSLFVAVIALTLFLMMTGCANTSDPVSSRGGSAAAGGSANGGATPYPTPTDAQIANLIPGYQVLKVDERAYMHDGTLDDQTSVHIQRTVGGTVSHHNNGAQIVAWQLWEDETVTVSTPNPGSAIVDFYPHPYHFNGCIRMWLDLSHVQLPPGVRWDQIRFYYRSEDGELKQYWGQLDLNAMRYYAWPDHFSRYIITAPTGD